MPDVSIRFDVEGRFKGREVSVAGLMKLNKFMRQEVTKELKLAGDHLISRLVFEFNRVIRERPRNSEYPNGSSELLDRRMVPAYVSKLITTQDEISLFMFDLFQMDWVTRGEGKGTWDRGWFMRLIDGHDGYDHGSRDWGFIRLDFAMDLAKECADKFIHKDSKKTQWLAEMQRQFAGRHNEGIMVKLNEPLFFEFPKFGFAGDYIGRQGHPGYPAWPALQTVGQEMTDPNGMVSMAIKSAFDRAASRVS